MQGTKIDHQIDDTNGCLCFKKRYFDVLVAGQVRCLELTFAFGHRTRRARLPVRSVIVKPCTALVSIAVGDDARTEGTERFFLIFF